MLLIQMQYEVTKNSIGPGKPSSRVDSRIVNVEPFMPEIFEFFYSIWEHHSDSNVHETSSACAISK